MMECSASVLKASVTMGQRMGIRVTLNCLIKGLANEWIIVPFAETIGRNAPVIKVQDGTQVEFMCLKSFIPFEFCCIGKPFLVGLCGVKLTIQQIFGNILRTPGLSGTTMIIVFYSRPYISGTTDSQLSSCHSHGYHGHDVNHH